MVNTEWVEKFTEWLSAGSEDSDKIVDIPWETEVEEIDEETAVIKTAHPKMPFSISVLVGPQFASLWLDTNITTDTMSTENRMSVYKKLLITNRDLNLMKLALYGDDNKVIVLVDLDLSSLNKDEFNHALEKVLTGSYAVINIFGLEKDLAEFMFNKMVTSVHEMVKAQTPMPEIMNYLTNTLGLEKEEADKFMKDFLEALENEMPAEEKAKYDTGIYR